MISREDIIALCGLTEAEVAAVAEHEHVPEMTAAALADYLLHLPSGPERIRQMIVDDIKVALDTQHLDHAFELMVALKHFMSENEAHLGRRHKA